MRHDRIALLGAGLFWSASVLFIALPVLWPAAFVGF